MLLVLLLLAADAPRFVLQHEDALGEATWLDTATHGHRRYTVNDGLPDPSIQAIATDHEGRLWIGTQDGAALFNGTAWRPLELQTKLRSTEVRRVLRGKDGAMYVGTFGGGLVRKTRAGETLIDQRRGLADNEVRALAEDDRGALWIATSSALNVLAGDAVTVARPVDVAIDAICVSGGEIFVPIGKELQRYASADRRPTGAAIPLGDAVRSCLASDDGSVWLGGETSLMRVKDGAVERFGKDALGTVQFYALAEGTVRGERTLWAGTQNGELVTYARGRFSKRTLVSSAISALAFTSLGVPLLWVGSQEGIVRQNLGGWRAFPSGPAFLRQRTKGIVEDGRGRLWIGTALGLGVADKTRTSFFTANAALGDSHIFSMK